MTEETKKPDLHALQDRAVEFAKDLLMVDFTPLVLDLDGEGVISDGFATRGKFESFRRLVVTLHAARWAAAEFRQAHVEDARNSLRAAMEAQVAERLAEIDRLTLEAERRAIPVTLLSAPLDPAEVERRRAS